MADNTSATDKPAEGEPGLEDIRSSWQKLDASSSAPKNLEEWQMRQKALKDQERKKQQASAAMLHNYRGDLKESDTKLAALREEDRRNKLNAERLLHGYRAPVGTVKSPQRTTNSSGIAADAVASHPGVSDVQSGDVASIAKTFDITADESVPEPANPTTVADVPDKADLSNTEAETKGLATIEPVAVATSAVPEETSTKPDIPMAPAATEDLDNSGVLVKEPELVAETNQLQSDDWVAVTPPDERAVPTANPNEGITYAEAKQNAPGQPHHMDIEFSFGLVSNLSEAQLSLAKYMKAVEEIVQTTVDQNVGRLTYNPNHPPFVRNIEKDDSFTPPLTQTNVVRYLVHGAVPAFVSDGTDFRSSRALIRRALKAAVKDGSFMSAAQRLEQAGTMLET